MTEIILTSHVLLFENDKVLLVRHGESAGHITGVYGIPGGHVEPDEDLQTTAVREFREETGLDVEKSDLQEFPGNEYTADIQRKDGMTRRYTMYVFLATQYTGQLQTTSETIPEWIDVNALHQFNLLPNVEHAVQTGLAAIK